MNKTYLKLTTRSALSLGLLLAATHSAQAAGLWDDGAGTTKWEDALNWDDDQVPGTRNELDVLTTANIVILGDSQVEFDAATWTALGAANLLHSSTEYRGGLRLLMGENNAGATNGSHSLTFDHGDGLKVNFTTGSSQGIGTRVNKESTLNLLSGTVDVGGNPFTIGGAGVGTLNVSGGLFIAGRSAPNLGTATGMGELTISGGSFITRAGITIGTNGTLNVVGSAATEIGMGSSGSLDGEYIHQAGGVLSVAIDSEGLTPIFVDDNGEGTIQAQFEAGAILDPSFIGPEQFGTWTVLELAGTDIVDNGLVLAAGADPLWSFEVDNSGVNGKLTLTYGTIPADLYWNGDKSIDWDINTTANWADSTLAPDALFTEPSEAIFNDALTGTTTPGTVNLTTAITMATVNVSNDSVDYNFTGIGSLSGTVAITKSGTGDLTIANTGINDFSGEINLNGGTITLGSATSFGSAAGALNVNSGTLDLGGFAVTKGDVSVNGAIDNGTLTASSILADSATINATIAGASTTLTKTGSGTLILNGTNTYDGLTTIDGGTVQLASAAAFGSSVGSTDFNNGTLEINGLTITETFTAFNGTIVNNNTSTATEITNEAVDAGYVTFDGPGDFVVNNIRQTNGVTRRITKNGSGTLTLGGTASNSRFGLTVNEGDVFLNKPEGQNAVDRFPLILSNVSSTVTLLASNQIHDSQDLNGDHLIDAGTLELNGFDEGVTRLKNTDFDPDGVITNSNIGSTSTLTLLTGELDGDYSGTISGNLNLVKQGTSRQLLAGPLTYTGDTTVDAGILELWDGSVSLLDDNSAVFITDGILDLSNGQTDVVDQLWIDGVQQPAGTYGSSDSDATNVDDVHFAGSGQLSVTSSPVVTDPFGTWATDNGLTTGSDAPTDDPDGDGSNLYEYFFWDSDPQVAEAFGSELTGIDASGALIGDLTFSHDRPQDISDVTVTYQWSSALSAGWNDDGASDGTSTVSFVTGTTGSPANGNGADYESVEVTASVTAGSTPTQIFVRVTVAQP